MKTKHLFLIRTPLQYMNAMEAILSFKLNPHECTIINLTDFQKSKNQINNLKTPFQTIKQVHLYLSINKRGSKFVHLLKSILNYIRLNILLQLTIKKYSRLEYLFVGHIDFPISAYICKKVRAKNYIFLEDGVATIDIVYRRELNKRAPFKIKKKQNSNFFSQASLDKWFLPKINEVSLDAITFFTVYNRLNVSLPDKLEANNLTFYKSLKSANQKSLKEIWFLGQPLVDVGIMKKEMYLQLIDKALNIAYKNNTKLVYIPHRSENLLKEITNKDIEIKYLNESVETYLLTSKVIPEKVIGYISSALINLNILFNNEEIELSHIDVEGSLLIKKEEISRILSYIKSEKGINRFSHECKNLK